MNILPNISRNKDKQTMKFGQLIEHNMWNICLEKSSTIYGGEANPRNFYKKSVWPLAFSLHKAFKKNWLELISLPHFLHDFWREIVLTLYLINWPNFIVWLSLLLEIFGNMCILIIWCRFSDIINFEIKHSVLVKPLFNISKSSGKKSQVNSQERKILKSIFYHF